MNHARIRIREENLLKLVLDFLTSRNFNVSMRTLEKESGVVNSPYSDDVLFLRELILDGDWEEVLQFVQPFESYKEFNSKQFRYLILKQKFLELLSLKSHIVGKQSANSIEDVMKTLSLLEETCPSKEEYSNLCWLLTVPNLNERSEFKDWTLDNSRIKCFTAVLSIIGKVLTLERKARNVKTASKDRLLQLIVKGLLYESCIEFCQSKATGSHFTESNGLSVRTNVLQGIADDYSADLLSWVRSLNDDVFSQPFEQVSIEIILEKLIKNVNSLRHSVDVPQNVRQNRNNNALYRSLSSLDPAVVHKVKPKINSQSPLVSKESSVTENPHMFHSSENRQIFYPEKTDSVKFDNILKDDKDSQNEIETNRMTSQEKHDNYDEDKIFVESQRIDQGIITSKSLPKSLPKNILLEQSKAAGSLQRVVRPNIVNSEQPVEEDSHKEEEKERRESVMRKLEEYENRKKQMQQQLEEMTRPRSRGDNSNEYGIPLPTKDVQPINRHYVSAKDLVTSYDTKQTDDDLKVENVGVKSLTTDASVKPATLSKRSDLNGRTQNKIVQEKPGNKVHSVKEEREKIATISGNTSQQPKETKNKVSSKPLGHVVNLTDGSGMINTSTPKRMKKDMTETPPPEASPVRPTEEKYSTTPKTRGFKKEVVPSGLVAKERILKRISSKETEEKEETDFEGKENKTPGDGQNERKGPMINGVRRALTSPHTVNPFADEQDLKTPEKEYNFSGKSNKEKTKPEGDFTSKPVELKPAEPKPFAKQVETAPASKGPGPKIKMRDGSKVLVTELLKSREEIKNASANSQRPDSFDQGDQDESPKSNNEKETREIESRLDFMPVCMLEDSQAIRAVCFHPEGKLFAIGSNSKVLRVCTEAVLDTDNAHNNESIPQPSVVFKRNKYHKGSIYCMAWNPLGDIIATGSNDKSIKLLHFDPDNYVQEGTDSELNIHIGTVRELAFVPDKPAILISGGAGDGGIQITDCGTCQTIGTLRGHSGNVMAVYTGEGDLVATGSTDNTLRLWDLRSHRCIDVILVGDSSPASVALSSNGSYLASGQEDGCMMLYDISAGRTLQSFRLHQEDCRSVRFSPDSRYLLTGSYDTDISILHTEGNLELTVPRHYKIAGHKDKVIQCRWHPRRCAFLSTSADRTAVLWSSGYDRNLMFS